jgi:photosystem II stability/assembly factor-like uncharacterized protein
MERVSARGRRALTLIGLAVAAVAALGAAHLGPNLVRPSAQRPAPQPSPVLPPRLAYASFGDAEHGAVTMSSGLTTFASYVTRDGGRTWSPRPPGLVETFLDRDHAVGVALGAQVRLETTADAGRSWAVEQPPVGPQTAGSAVIGSVVAGPIFLDAANGWWFDPGPGTSPGPPALWRTGDGGRTWRRLAAGGLPAGTPVGALAFIDQVHGAIVTAPLSDVWPSLLTTRDGGGTWRLGGLPGPPEAGVHLAVAGPGAATLAAHGDRLFLSLTLIPATPNHGHEHWSSVSDDGGLSWTPWWSEPAPSLFPLAAPVFDEAGSLLLADDSRLWVSPDYGRTWQDRPMQMPPGARALTVVSAPSGALFVTAERGDDLESMLLRSLDAGTRWTPVPLPGAGG